MENAGVLKVGELMHVKIVGLDCKYIYTYVTSLYIGRQLTAASIYIDNRFAALQSPDVEQLLPVQVTDLDSKS